MNHYEHVIKPLSELTEYDSNSRTHSAEQVEQVERSIKEFGFTNPILISEDGGIIAGHCRAMAAANVGMNEIPCIVVDGLSEQQKSALVIADNKLAESAGWDKDALKSELNFLDDADFDLSLTGFDDDELGKLMEMPEGELDLSDIADPQAPDKQSQAFCPNCGEEIDLPGS